MLLMKCQSTYMIKSEACYVTSQMKSLGFPKVARVFCPVVFKIILSLAHVVFTKAVYVEIQGTAAYCVELASAIMCRLLNTEAFAIHYRISTVLSKLMTESSFGEKSERSLLTYQFHFFQALRGPRPLIDTCQKFSTSPANHELRTLANGGFQNSGGLSASVSFLPFPHPHISVLALSPFSARAKHQKSRSLLPNPTETLATQATPVAFLPTPRKFRNSAREFWLNGKSTLCLQNPSILLPRPFRLRGARAMEMRMVKKKGRAKPKGGGGGWGGFEGGGSKEDRTRSLKSYQVFIKYLSRSICFVFLFSHTRIAIFTWTG